MEFELIINFMSDSCQAFSIEYMRGEDMYNIKSGDAVLYREYLYDTVPMTEIDGIPPILADWADGKINIEDVIESVEKMLYVEDITITYA